MTIGAEMQRQTTALIANMGYDVTFRRSNSGGTYDPATGTITGGSNADETARGAFVNYGAGDIDGSSVQRGDRKFIMAATYNGTALTKTPQIADQIIGEGDTVNVVSVQTIKANASVVAYILQTRE